MSNKELTEKDLTFTLLKSNGSGFRINAPVDALGVISNIVNAASAVGQFCEQEETKRCEIEKEKQIAIEKIKTQREIFLTYLDKTFDERKASFAKYFDVVDDAIQKGNLQQLAIGLNHITDLAKSSPFKNLLDLKSVGAALENKNTEWDF